MLDITITYFSTLPVYILEDTKNQIIKEYKKIDENNVSSE